MFPDEHAAVTWFERQVWPHGRCCGHCGSLETRSVPHAKPMPYWCTDCRSYFSVRTGTALERSKVPLRKWAFAIYLEITNLKSISSMKLHRDVGVTQSTAWFMLHRIREAWRSADGHTFSARSKWTKPTSAARNTISTSGRNSTRDVGQLEDGRHRREGS